jgi:hypothetical protein
MSAILVPIILRYLQYISQKRGRNFKKNKLSLFRNICAFSRIKFEFFWGFWQKILNISASAQRILTQKPDLERLLNSTNYVITQI